MKKSLVALAALAVSGTVMAQATIYGRTDVAYGIKSLSNANGATTVKQSGVMDGGNAGSRIGFRGTEDLGGGMKAHFVTEQGISPTNGALFGVRTATAGIQYDGYAAASGNDPGSAGAYSQGTNRQTYLGLEGGFGTIRVGYQYTTIYEISTLSGFTNTSEGIAGGNVAHLWGSGAAGGTRANGIAYISPKLAGAWTVGLQMGSGAGRESTEWGTAATNTASTRTLDKQSRTSLHVDYNSGPLRAALGYTSYNVDLSGTTAGATTTTPVASTVNTFNVYGALSSAGAAAVAGNTTYTTNMTQLAGSYNFGMLKAGVTINSGAKTATSGPANGTQAATTSAGTYNFASRALSVSMPMGKMELVGGMGNSSLDSAGTVLADWSSSQVGAKYSFSKRTTLYGYTGTATDNNATAATAFKVITGTIVGIDHQF